MKLLIFSPYYPPHIGGLETHADEFNKYLSEKGADISVFTPNLPKNSPDFEIVHNNVKVHRFPAFEIIPNYPLPKFWQCAFWKLFFSLFNQKFDIIISRTRFFNTSLLALIYAKIKRVHWIHIEHGSDFVQLSSKFKTIIAKIYDYTFGAIIFKCSDQNISISKAVQRFVKKFDKRESPIIFRGLDIAEIDKIQPSQEIKEQFQNKIIISFVGRLYKWKGVENSINAIKSLPRDLKEKIVFLIIGDGEDFSTLKKLSKDEECIQMLGNLSREKAIGITKISDIYLHSAQPGGGLSTSILEAMYCECTIIATPNEGANEVINNNINGIITDNSTLFSEKITLLASDEKSRKNLSKNAKNYIVKNFNWNESITKYEKIFSK
jgi:glycosyltransferase involved in cell wall biosynthesis